MVSVLHLQHLAPGTGHMARAQQPQVVVATTLDHAVLDLPHSPCDLCLLGTDTFSGGLQGAATGNDWRCHEWSLQHLRALSLQSEQRLPMGFCSN